MTAVTEEIPQALAATAGPGGQVPVAFLGRVSSERLQDPVASLRRQVRNAHAWLPAGCQIVAYYWDVETAGWTWRPAGTETHGRSPPPPGSPATAGWLTF